MDKLICLTCKKVLHRICEESPPAVTPAGRGNAHLRCWTFKLSGPRVTLIARTPRKEQYWS